MKHVLITGCSSGIGFYCLNELSKDENYKVYGTCRSEEDFKLLSERGLEVFMLESNSSESVHKCMRQVLSKSGGKLDVLFNNIGYGQPGAVEDLSRDVMREQFETNVFGVMELSSLAMRVFREQNSGKLIFNSSILGFAAMAYRGAYNASKFALEGFADTMRQEVMGSGIDVVLIEPGPILSKFRQTALGKFKKNIDIEKSFHKETYQKTLKRLESTEDTPFTLGADAVFEVLMQAIKAKKSKARYKVTFPTKLFWYLMKILPTKILDKLLLKASE